MSLNIDDILFQPKKNDSNPKKETKKETIKIPPNLTSFTSMSKSLRRYSITSPKSLRFSLSFILILALTCGSNTATFLLTLATLSYAKLSRSGMM